jgi:hypothetical protein
MKNLLIAFVLLLTVASCLPKKNSDPAPIDLAGTYTVTSAKYNGQELIVTGSGVSGNVVVTRPSDLLISFTLTLRDNTGPQTSSANNVAITKATSGYNILSNAGANVGAIDGTNFSLNLSSGGNTTSIVAKK